MKQATLCFLVDKANDSILLAMKKRGFGVGLWNGVGGKVQDNESIENAMKRETKEEIEVDVIDYEKVGEIQFNFEDKSISGQNVHVYLARAWEGFPMETEEMKPQWFSINEIPYAQMWEDDKYWMPIILNGKFVKAKFKFSDENALSYFKINANSNNIF